MTDHHTHLAVAALAARLVHRRDVHRGGAPVLLVCRAAVLPPALALSVPLLVLVNLLLMLWLILVAVHVPQSALNGFGSRAAVDEAVEPLGNPESYGY